MLEVMVPVVVVVIAVVGVDVDVLAEVTSSTTGANDDEEDFRLRPFFLENSNDDSNGDNLPVWYACGNTYALTNDKTVTIHFIRNVCDRIGIDMDMYNKPQTITATNDGRRPCCGSCDKFGLYPIATVAKIIFHNPATIQNVDHDQNGGIIDSIIVVVVNNNGGVMLYHTPNHVILTASTFHFVGGSSSSSISVSTLLL